MDFFNFSFSLLTVFLQFWISTERALSKFAFQACQVFIGNLNKNDLSNLVSPFWENLILLLWLTKILDLVDPGTCRDIFANVICIMLQKKSYRPFFSFHARRRIEKIANMALLNPCMKLNIPLGCKKQHHGQTIHPTENLISMNLFKILCIVKWAWFFEGIRDC